MELSLRNLEIMIRWSEVKVKRIKETIFERQTYEFDVKGDVVVQIRISNEHTHHPELMVYLGRGEYPDDILLQLYMDDDLSLSVIRRMFTDKLQNIRVCPCGRLGRDHELVSENGKCNNCYIYGFIRGADCAICMMDDGKPWMQTSCGHFFHDVCWNRIIYELNSTIRKCPMCRTRQSTDDITFL